VSFALVDSHGRLRGVQSDRRFRSASVIKAMLLVAELERRGDDALTHTEQRLLGPMIRRSSNTAAHRVYQSLGPERVLRLARRARMRHFALPALFEARITAADQARFFARLDAYVPERHRGYARALLAGIVPEQRWGIPTALPAGWTVYFKGGWREGLVHQVARLERADGLAFALAVLTDHDPSQEYGQATVAGIASRLLR
jgi:beta-lactamase class A